MLCGEPTNRRKRGGAPKRLRIRRGAGARKAQKERRGREGRQGQEGGEGGREGDDGGREKGNEVEEEEEGRSEEFALVASAPPPIDFLGSTTAPLPPTATSLIGRVGGERSRGGGPNAVVHRCPSTDSLGDLSFVAPLPPSQFRFAPPPPPTPREGAKAIDGGGPHRTSEWDGRGDGAREGREEGEEEVFVASLCAALSISLSNLSVSPTSPIPSPVCSLSPPSTFARFHRRMALEASSNALAVSGIKTIA